MRRRDFLKVGSLGVMNALAVSGGHKGYSDELAATQKRVGLIGAGWYGMVDLLRLIQVAPVEVAALCDVNDEHLEDAGKRVAERQHSGKTPRFFHDWRTMLEDEQLDLVLVGTPDHWHALPAIAAMEKGIPVYMEKPIGVDVVECQALTATAKRTGVKASVNLQRRATPHLLEMKKQIIDSGELGQVAQVDIYSYYGGGDVFQNACDPPEGFDFDLWTGPAPMRPFYPMLANGGWREFIEYGNGTLGDMGVHMFDMVRWLLGLGWPSRVFSVGGQYVYTRGVQTIPDTQTAVFDYNNLQVIWNHRRWSGLIDRRHPWGAYIRGTGGLLKASVFGWDFIPKGKDEPTASGDAVIESDKFPEDVDERRIEIHTCPGIRGLLSDLLGRIDDGGETLSPISEGAISSISCILGNISAELRRPLVYDPATGTIPGDDEATARLARTYRSGWEHPRA